MSQASRPVFRNRILPYALMAPQLAITAIFFLWPAGQAVWQSLLQQDAFGLTTLFVGLENYRLLFSSPDYLRVLGNTAIFGLGVTATGLCVGLLLAVMVDRIVRGVTFFRTLLIWPYAVAPAVSAMVWWLSLHPQIGILSWLLRQVGYEWNNFVNGTDAMIMVIFASAWTEISYDFLFFLAGLQAIPRSLTEAAAIDGAGPIARFWTIVFPLLSPTTFFLVVVNMVYAFFETFPIIHATTMGGPAGSTETLVYKVFADGVIGLDLGGSAAQSVVLMAIVIGLTAIQFRYIERRVHY